MKILGILFFLSFIIYAKGISADQLIKAEINFYKFRIDYSKKNLYIKTGFVEKKSSYHANLLTIAKARLEPLLKNKSNKKELLKQIVKNRQDNVKEKEKEFQRNKNSIYGLAFTAYYKSSVINAKKSLKQAKRIEKEYIKKLDEKKLKNISKAKIEPSSVEVKRRKWINNGNGKLTQVKVTAKDKKGKRSPETVVTRSIILKGKRFNLSAKLAAELAKKIKAMKATPDHNSIPPKIAIETPRKKPKQFFVKPIVAPLIPKRPTNAIIIPPPKITPKPMIVNQSNRKTVLKNVNILTKAKTGNINTKGKLNVANIKVAKGTTLKDTNINADVNVKNISVSKGSTADIGSVNITK